MTTRKRPGPPLWAFYGLRITHEKCSNTSARTLRNQTRSPKGLGVILMRWPAWLSPPRLDQHAKATLLVHRAFVKVIDDRQVNEFAGQPPSGKCPYRNWFEKNYCGRELLEGHEMCFFHTPDPKKYLPTTVEKYFGKSMTLNRALESEVASGRSLSGAWLRNAPLHGTFIDRAGVNLSKADLRFADLSGAHLSYGSLTN